MTPVNHDTSCMPVGPSSVTLLLVRLPSTHIHREVTDDLPWVYPLAKLHISQTRPGRSYHWPSAVSAKRSKLSSPPGI